MVNMQGAIKLSPNAACFLEFHSLLEQDAHVACFRWSWGSFHDERINAPWPSAGGTLCSRFHSFISGSCRVHLCVQRRGRVRTVPAQRDLRLTGWQRHSLQSTNWTKHYESSRERRQKKKKGLEADGREGGEGGELVKSTLIGLVSSWCASSFFFFSGSLCALCAMCFGTKRPSISLFFRLYETLFFFSLSRLLCLLMLVWCATHATSFTCFFFSLLTEYKADILFFFKRVEQNKKPLFVVTYLRYCFNSNFFNFFFFFEFSFAYTNS